MDNDRLFDLYLEIQGTNALKKGYPEYRLKIDYFAERWLAENLKGPKTT